MLLSPKGLIVQMHIASGVIYVRVDLHLDKLVGWIRIWTNWSGTLKHIHFIVDA